MNLASNNSHFPHDAFVQLGKMRPLNLAHMENMVPHSSAPPYQVSLRFSVMIATMWLTVALGLGVHHLACPSLVNFGPSERVSPWQGWIRNGRTLGFYFVSEPRSRLDATALNTSVRAKVSRELCRNL